VVPGRIAIVRDARGPVKVRVTVPVTNGWKAIALSDGARQELFSAQRWVRTSWKRRYGGRRPSNGTIKKKFTLFS
jgi:hypothetical protein